MNVRTKLAGIAALAVLGTGVGLGVALSGGSSTAHPVVIRPVDQPVVITTTDTPTDTVPSPVTVTVTPNTPASTEAAVTAPTEQDTTKAADEDPQPSFVPINPSTPNFLAPVPPPAPTTAQGTPVLPSSN